MFSFLKDMLRSGDAKDTSAVATTVSQLPISVPEAAFVNEKLKELYKCTLEVQSNQSASEGNLNSLKKTQEKFQSDLQKHVKTKLKGSLKIAISDAEKEAETLRKCLKIISDIRSTVRSKPRKLGMYNNKETSLRRGALMKMLQQSAQTLPLFVACSRDESPPPLCGAVPAEFSYIVKMGDMVAALVKAAENDESNWILAEVVMYNSSTSKYEIDDIDEEQKERHYLSRRRVVPLPVMRANPETDPEALFEKSATVLALYPQTTCFYKGIIHETPKTAQDDYQVLFEDPSYAEGYSPPLCVPQRYVIVSKEMRKKNL
ncbi:SAGA-associated factor 29 [Halotydeus destructor]|nr:SAGA-associated factor 29 [Halotydeus destructor]